jgi:hypothetical protein
MREDLTDLAQSVEDQHIPCKRIVTIHAPGIARAEVYVSGGRRISVSGCSNIADAVAPYVPPPAYYAPLPDDPPPPPNVSGCVSYNGRWVSAGGC